MRLASYSGEGAAGPDPPFFYLSFSIFYLFFSLPSPRKIKYQTRRQRHDAERGHGGGGERGVEAIVQPGGGGPKQKEPATPPHGEPQPHPSRTDQEQRVPADPGGRARLTAIPQPRWAAPRCVPTRRELK